MIPEYLAADFSPKCLELGAWGTTRLGWLCTDLDPPRPDVARLDASQPFPLPDASFDFAFSEHMIEHLTLSQGQAMLRECHRVLKPGGVVRVVTPSIEFLFDMWNGRNRPYTCWAAEQFCPVSEPVLQRTAVFNNFVRAWGHQFIYDGELLRCVLMQAGFRRIRQEQLLLSEHVPLQGLENVRRMLPGFLAFESMILEATKP